MPPTDPKIETKQPLPGDPTADQIANLPKWARDHIAGQEREIKALTTTLAQLQGTEETDVSYRDGMQSHPLPQMARVMFRFKSEKRDVSIGVSMIKGCLQVQCDDALVVLPQAANSVRLLPMLDDLKERILP
jgi:hypothetical protein